MSSLRGAATDRTVGREERRQGPGHDGAGSGDAQTHVLAQDGPASPRARHRHRLDELLAEPGVGRQLRREEGLDLRGDDLDVLDAVRAEHGRERLPHLGGQGVGRELLEAAGPLAREPVDAHREGQVGRDRPARAALPLEDGPRRGGEEGLHVREVEEQRADGDTRPFGHALRGGPQLAFLEQRQVGLDELLAGPLGPPGPAVDPTAGVVIRASVHQRLRRAHRRTVTGRLLSPILPPSCEFT